jgi:hypothetical protein
MNGNGQNASPNGPSRFPHPLDLKPLPLPIPSVIAVWKCEVLEMNKDIIATIEAEEAELAAKLDAVRQLLSVYRGESGQAAPPQTKAGSQKARRAARSTQDRMDKFGPYGQRIVDYADRMLPGCEDNPIPTRVLVERLEGRGLQITGENKVNSLSALLARSSKMKGWGRAGWTRAAVEAGDLSRQDSSHSQGRDEIEPSEGGYPKDDSETALHAQTEEATE